MIELLQNQENIIADILKKTGELTSSVLPEKIIATQQAGSLSIEQSLQDPLGQVDEFNEVIELEQFEELDQLGQVDEFNELIELEQFEELDQLGQVEDFSELDEPADHLPVEATAVVQQVKKAPLFELEDSYDSKQ